MNVNHFTTVEAFLQKLSKLASDNKLEFTPPDHTIATRRLENAYNAIAGILLVRGLTVEQISTWVRGEEFQLDIATYWYGRDSKWGRKNFEDVDWLKIFDRQNEITSLAIISNDGVVLLPGSECVAVGIDLRSANEDKGWLS